MPEVQVRGGRVHYEIAGSGPFLALLHGIGGSSRSWRYQLAGLADALTVVAWDAPDYPDAPDDGPSMADYADDLAGLLDHLGAEQASLVGMSWGGIVELAFYRRHADRVRALILADTNLGGGALPEAVRSRRLAERLAVATPADMADLARRRTPALFSAHADPAVLREAEAIMAAIPPLSYRQRANAAARADNRDVLPRVAVPTLLLWGEEDGITPLAGAEELQRGIPSAQRVVIPACGHASNQERPEEFNAAVRSFLRAHAVAAAG